MITEIEAELQKALTAGLIARVCGMPIEKNPWEEGTDHFEAWQHGWSHADFQIDDKSEA